MTPERKLKLLSVLGKRQTDLTVVLENVFDPHNEAAVMRSCDSVGIQDIFIINNRKPPRRAWGFRSGSGAKKWLTVHQFVHAKDCFAELRKRYNKILTTHLSSDAVSVYDIDFTESIALVFGNERFGVSEEVKNLADGNFSIPQVGIIPSLNISVACAVTIYEAYRQKRKQDIIILINYPRKKYVTFLMIGDITMLILPQIKTMKFLLILMLLLAGLAHGAVAQTGVKVPIKKVTAKEVRLMIDESTVPMIVNFWATWCGPCIREIPWFDSIIASKNSPVKLVLVSLDYKSVYEKQLPAFVEKKGYKGEVLYLNETDVDYYVSVIDPKWKGSIPASIFVNNSSNYYQLFNEQIPKQRFGLELDKVSK